VPGRHCDAVTPSARSQVRSWQPLGLDPSRFGLVGYTGRPMSKVCAVCGKKPGFGNNRSHSMVATKRRFNPNLQHVRVLLKGKPTRAYVCTRCLKGGKVQKAI